MEAEKNLAHEILKEENQEEILKKAGCRDLIELMKCKNCLYYKDGKCLDSKLDMDANGHCAIWTENLATKNILKNIYENIKSILIEFMDIEKNNIEIISLWIIGTWLHKFFPTYPYLFINATKGSGKTRLLKIIKTLSWQGDMLASLSEAVMFRTMGTLCIDEFEGINNKDKNALRELLNTAYKKGGKVKRMRKKHTPDGEIQVVEEFSTFRPIVMANISGMEEILGDRCINIIIEKSIKSNIVRKIEDFENHPLILKLLQEFSLNDFNVVSVVNSAYLGNKSIYREWNNYLDNHTITTLNTTNIITTYNTLNTTNMLTTPDTSNSQNILNQQSFSKNINLNTLFDIIYNTNLDGRNLELCFPLFLIAGEIGILDKIIPILQTIMKDKTENDFIESFDVQLIDFISKQDKLHYYKISELCFIFKQFINYEPETENKDWLNNKWMGRALKRLNLIGKKRRMGYGTEVILNIDKATEKINIFK